jgi:hypothetical protein
MNYQQWFYESNGQQAGPISWSALLVGLKQGVLTPETLVWSEGLPGWVPLVQVMGSPGSLDAVPPLASSSQLSSFGSAPVPPTFEAGGPSQSVEKPRPGVGRWLLRIAGVLILLALLVGFLQGFFSKQVPFSDSKPVRNAPVPTDSNLATPETAERAQLEKEIVSCAQNIDMYTAEINSMASANNAKDIVNYIRRDVALREQAMLKLRDLFQQYELRYGRPALIVFARQNGLQNAIGM